jgi:sugar-specific transcriptional regulator TrmB
LEYEDQVKILIQLGLTANQAKIYLTLAKTEKATASQIAQNSKIGREEIYRIMPKLQQLGLIESSMEKPVHYKAVTEKTAIRILIDRRKAENSEIEEKTCEFLSSIIQRKQQLAEAENMLTLVSGKEHLRQLSTDIINRVNVSLDIVCTYQKLVGWLETHEKTLKKILKRKIPVRFIVEEPVEGKCLVTQTLAEFEKQLSFQCKTLPKILTCLGIYDDGEITIIAATRTPTYEGPVYWSNNLSLVEVGKAYFETLWNSTNEK